MVSIKRATESLGCSRKTFLEAISFRYLATEELYGRDQRTDSPRSIWWDLSNEARGFVILEAAGLAFDEVA